MECAVLDYVDKWRVQKTVQKRNARLYVVRLRRKKSEGYYSVVRATDKTKVIRRRYGYAAFPRLRDCTVVNWQHRTAIRKRDWGMTKNVFLLWRTQTEFKHPFTTAQVVVVVIVTVRAFAKQQFLIDSCHFPGRIVCFSGTDQQCNARVEWGKKCWGRYQSVQSKCNPAHFTPFWHGPRSGMWQIQTNEM